MVPAQLYLVTARPQVPELARLAIPTGSPSCTTTSSTNPLTCPTFSSFSLLCNLSEDSRPLASVPLHGGRSAVGPRTCRVSDFLTADGRLKLYAKLESTDDGKGWQSDRLSPWESALAYSNHLLDERYGHTRRMTIKHAPVFFDRDDWAAFSQQFKDAVEFTSASRFRSKYNVAVGTYVSVLPPPRGAGGEASVRLLDAFRDTSYLGLGNLPLVCGSWGWPTSGCADPMFYCLNDNFGDTPHRAVVRRVQRWLEASYPEPSRFERPAEGEVP